MSIKSAIAPRLHSLALATGASASRAKAQTAGRIITFHGVGDASFPTEVLETHLRWLATHFQVVSMDTLLKRLASGLTDEVVLTFDDGLRNNFTHAYPILEQLGLPATFFIVPGMVETGRWLWTHEIRARLSFLPEKLRRQWLPEAPAFQDETLINHLKTLGLGDRLDAEKRLRLLTSEFRPGPALRERCDLMSWDELRALDPALITLGSHTLTHPILSNLNAGEISNELVESHRLLTTRLQRPVEFFCYPNGSFNDEVVRSVQQNYRAAVCNIPALVRPGANFHLLPRIGATPDISLLAWRMHRPGA